MATWEVIADDITLTPHPNADTLEIGKVGLFQIVTKKGTYSTGDLVVFAPERSILPEEIRDHYKSSTGNSYLVGAQHDRVHGVTLRGEPSDGVLLPLDFVYRKLGTTDIPRREDLSARLDITKYEPPIPLGMAGDVENLQDYWQDAQRLGEHDVERYQIFAEAIPEGEPVIITEKLHGSQIAILRSSRSDELKVSSKGLLNRRLGLKYTLDNIYWFALTNTPGAAAALAEFRPGCSLQAWGEVIPCQHLKYGQVRPSIYFYRVTCDGADVPREALPPALQDHWVPVLYAGPFKKELLGELAKKNEQVSGKELHHSEGIVVRPVVLRNLPDTRSAAFLKVLNPKYHARDDEIA